MILVEDGNVLTRCAYEMCFRDVKLQPWSPSALAYQQIMEISKAHLLNHNDNPPGINTTE